MELFLFANFFPYKKSEPFLANEFPYTKKNSNRVSVFTLYGESNDAPLMEGVKLFKPLLPSPSAKLSLFLKGKFNLSPLHLHLRELISGRVLLHPKRIYWLMVSLLMTRMVLASKSYKELTEEIRNSENPVLYFYWGDNLCWIIPYLVRQHKKKLNIVIRFHGSDLYEELKGNYAPLRANVFRCATRLFTVSEFGARYLKEKYPRYEEKIMVSRLGVQDHGLNPPGEKTTILSISNLVPLKRVHLVFEALQHSNRKITWHHFGDGPLSGPIKDLVKEKREELEVILHGHVSNDTLVTFLRSTHITLMMNTSSTEGLPVSIMEAFSFGIPVIATNVGGVGELVTEQTGALIPAVITGKQVEAVMENFLNKTEAEISKVRENAKKVFRDKVWAEKNYSAFYELLNRL